MGSILPIHPGVYLKSLLRILNQRCFVWLIEPRPSPCISVLEFLLLYHNNSGRQCLADSGRILHVRDLTYTRLH